MQDERSTLSQNQEGQQLSSDGVAHPKLKSCEARSLNVEKCRDGINSLNSYDEDVKLAQDSGKAKSQRQIAFIELFGEMEREEDAGSISSEEYLRPFEEQDQDLENKLMDDRSCESGGKDRLPQEEIKRMFKHIRNQVQLSEFELNLKIEDYNFLTGGKPLVEFTDKYTRMNLLQLACAQPQSERKELHPSPSLQLLKKVKKYFGLEYLLESAFLKANPTSGKTCLHYAAMAQNFECLWYLIRKAKQKKHEALLERAVFLKEKQTDCTPLELCFEAAKTKVNPKPFVRVALLLIDNTPQFSHRAVELLLQFAEQNHSLPTFKELTPEKVALKLLMAMISRFPNLLLEKFTAQKSSLVHLAARSDLKWILIFVILSLTQKFFDKSGSYFSFSRGEEDMESINDVLNDYNSERQTPLDLAYQAKSMEICLILHHFKVQHEGSINRDQIKFDLDQLKQGEFQLDNYIDRDAVSLEQILSGDTNKIMEVQFRNDRIKFPEVLIHLDLKGAPPKFEFLMDFVRYFAQPGKNRSDQAATVTGFLIEFEDMLPFAGNLHSIRNDRGPCYSKEEIQQLVKYITKDLKKKIVPLVQTFGHLEFVLKRQKFKPLREEPDKMISICPLKPESLDLAVDMVSQTIEVIGRENIPIFHIGADEVFNMGHCQQCSLFISEASPSLLFARFLRKLIKRLEARHNSSSVHPPIRFVAWDDMFRGWTTDKLDQLKINGSQKFEPCIWQYCGDHTIFDRTINEQTIGNTMVSFNKIWFASAFKGSATPSTTYVDHEQRLVNQFNWIELGRKCSFQEKIAGIILTGWARFTHETVLCELLPMSIPSLQLCLAIIDKQQLSFDSIFSDLLNQLLIDKDFLSEPHSVLNNLVGTNQLEKLASISPFIGCFEKRARSEVFCNDAFEIGFILYKADFLFDQVKYLVTNWAMINHSAQINQEVKEQEAKRQSQEAASREIHSAHINSIRERAKSQKEFKSLISVELWTDPDEFDKDRFCLDRILLIRKMTRVCFNLYKQASNMSQRILPKYMFEHDIDEFQNEKILDRLRESQRIYLQLTERVAPFGKRDDSSKLQTAHQFDVEEVKQQINDFLRNQPAKPENNTELKLGRGRLKKKQLQLDTALISGAIPDTKNRTSSAKACHNQISYDQQIAQFTELDIRNAPQIKATKSFENSIDGYQDARNSPQMSPPFSRHEEEQVAETSEFKVPLPPKKKAIGPPLKLKMLMQQYKKSNEEGENSGADEPEQHSAPHNKRMMKVTSKYLRKRHHPPTIEEHDDLSKKQKARRIQGQRAEDAERAQDPAFAFPPVDLLFGSQPKGSEQ